MKPALNEKDSGLPADWQQFAQGDLLAEKINQLLQPWWQQIFGYYLLKVGDLSSGIDTQNCKIQHHVNIGNSSAKILVKAEADALPIKAHSVDAVLLAHCLEFVTDPHHVVREAHRVLMPDGYLIVTGINPISMVGALSAMPWLQTKFPWSGRFFSVSRVKDWLHLVGFEVLSEQRFFCSTMLGENNHDSRVQRWVENYLSWFGASYLLVARKRELPLTPIRPKWQLTPQYNNQVKGVSARQGSANN
ncbi:class I SAM-dependent methyltransferase [Rheinheimera salexigens]|uniref:SAM-dependent methyltransferase n=1 Tax=Rheinheimera salexigens TaxID=1628148 RepID=A0A1E7Q5B2_9GAMM|nr:class I SAM-dependent methyltransferase [Rheinheimera salexigens]OEY69300.1 SAM-dependent methyltransferase [Rheinheimera salexigens]